MSCYIPMRFAGQECHYDRHTAVVLKKSRVWNQYASREKPAV